MRVVPWGRFEYIKSVLYGTEPFYSNTDSMCPGWCVWSVGPTLRAWTDAYSVTHIVVVVGVNIRQAVRAEVGSRRRAATSGEVGRHASRRVVLKPFAVHSMSNRKGKKGTQQGEQETDPIKLIADAEKLLNESPSEFLPPQQKVEFLKKSLEKAQRKLERAVELDDSISAVHHHLGIVLERTGRKSEATHSFIRAAALQAGLGDDLTLCDTSWADCIARAYSLLSCSSSEPRPSWWNEESMLAFSERAISLLPESLHANKFRADALSGFRFLRTSGSQVEASQRTPSQLRLAANHFSKAASKMNAAGAEEDQRYAVEAGAACLKDAIQAERQGGSSEAGVSGESAEAKAAREAEARAARNKKKKLAKRNKASAEDSGDRAGDGVMSGEQEQPAAGSHDAIAALAAAAALADASARPDTPVYHCSRYRWADPLPAGYAEVLAELDIRPGTRVSEVDLAGVLAEGGPAVAVAVGLLQLCGSEESATPAAVEDRELGVMSAEELKAHDKEELRKKQEAERKKAEEQDKRDAENAKRDAEIAAKGKRAAGGVHKFDPDEVDVHGGNSTADDFLGAFGF